MTRNAVKKLWGARLKRARQRTGLSQMALGSRVKMSQSKISKIEKGELIPDIYDYSVLNTFFRRHKIPLRADFRA